jgi:hypothetical protein
MSTEKNRIHEMLDRLDQGQLAAVAQLLEVMTDPVAHSLANAPVDDVPISTEEAATLDAAHAAIQRGEGIPHDEILREFGLIPG